ncbi:hypothetical protein [Terrisporobacter sp.]
MCQRGQKGKIAELALGYGGGVLDLKNMGAVKEIFKIICKTPPWADELLLLADGYKYNYYYKEK